ncbi:MAG: LacI family DNA-binding transcriptional regulator [Anaerolineales bacterium]
MPQHRSTSYDVAQLAGVSRTTVSFVINNLQRANISESTRQRVLRAAKELNYSPNASGRRLVSGKSNTLGLVLCQSPEQTYADAFLARVIFGIEQAAMQTGFQVLLTQVDPDNQNGYTHLISENHVDGIIISGPRQGDMDIVSLHQKQVPLMLLGQMPNTEIPFVDVNAAQSAEIAVSHLIELGHRQLAMITNARLTYTSAQQRLDGYRKAHEIVGLQPDERYIREGNYTPASGFQAMAELLTLSPRPTAVFVASDVVALGAMLAIKHAGLRIPEDIAIVGFDDVPLAEYFDPPLTTVRLPAFELGWSAGERLVRLLNHEELAQTGLLLETEFIVRASSQKARLSSKVS